MLSSMVDESEFVRISNNVDYVIPSEARNLLFK